MRAHWLLRLMCLLVSASVQTTAMAVEVQSLDVWRDGSNYLVDLQVKLDVSAAQAFAVMSDYQQLAQINSAVKSSKLMNGAAGDAQRVSADIRVCVAFFCRTLSQVQDMSASAQADGGGRIHADVVAHLSNLDAGVADWHVWPCVDGGASQQSCLSFRASLDPGFWVPPLIGPYLIKSTLEEEALETSLGIEAAAARYGTAKPSNSPQLVAQ